MDEAPPVFEGVAVKVTSEPEQILLPRSDPIETDGVVTVMVLLVLVAADDAVSSSKQAPPVTEMSQETTSPLTKEVVAKVFEEPLPPGAVVPLILKS